MFKTKQKMPKSVEHMGLAIILTLTSFALLGQNDSGLSKALEYEIKQKVLQDVQASKYLLLSQRADKLAKPMDRDFSTEVFFVSGFFSFFRRWQYADQHLKYQVKKVGGFLQ